MIHKQIVLCHGKYMRLHVPNRFRFLHRSIKFYFLTTLRTNWFTALKYHAWRFSSPLCLFTFFSFRYALQIPRSFKTESLYYPLSLSRSPAVRRTTSVLVWWVSHRCRLNENKCFWSRIKNQYCAIRRVKTLLLNTMTWLSFGIDIRDHSSFQRYVCNIKSGSVSSS